MKRPDRFYLVENESGEPCVSSDGVMMHHTKKSADREASSNRRQFEENYTVATFVRELPLPKRATGDAAARATDRLIGSADPNSIKSAFDSIERMSARGHAHVYRTVHGKNEGKPPPRLKRAKTSGRLVRGF